MTYKFAAIVSLLGTLVALILKSSYELGICFSDFEQNYFDVTCHSIFESLGDPLFYGAGALAIVFLALWLFPRGARAWKQFAIWYLPLAVSLFLFSRDPGSGDFATPYPETVYQWVGGIFVLISFAIIALNAKGERPVTNQGQGPFIGNRFVQIVWYAYIALVILSAIRFLLSD